MSKFRLCLVLLCGLAAVVVSNLPSLATPALPQMYVVEVIVEGQGTVEVDRSPLYNGPTTFPPNAHIYYTDPDYEGLDLQWTAAAAEGWQFDRWELGPNGDLTQSFDNPTTLALTPGGGSPSYWMVRAVFVQVTTYTIAVSANPTVGGTVTGGGTFASGTSVTATATASTGYTFVNWTEGGAEVSASVAYTFTVAADRTLVANFADDAVTTHTITVSANPTVGGTVTGGGTFASGTSVTVTATASMGYTFVNWTEGGAEVSASLAYTFTVAADLALVANFTQDAPPADGIDDDVEAGPGNWTAESLWHITDRESYSPTHSWWFGNERTGTYGAGEYSPQSLLPRRRGDVQPKGAGGRVQGALTSEAISVSGWGQTAAFSFRHWRHVEYHPDAAYDRTYVQVTFDGAVWRTVWSQDSQDPSQKEWEQVSVAVPIQDGATQMRVRFIFDSVDGLYNDYPGWFIDDIRLGPPGEPGVITVIAPLISGMVGQPYGPVHLAASGGVPPYTWTWRPAVPGLDLAPRSGTISGTPTTEGEFSVTITVRDSAGESGTLTATIIIGPSIVYDCLLFTEDFTDVAEWTMSSLWHIASDLDCIACASMIGDFAYFGRECSFATGVRVAGVLRSPAIDIPDGVEAVVIRFDQFRHVESDMGSFDRTWMEISFDERTWETLWHRDSASFSPQGSHEQVGRAVPAGVDRMWIRFRFDSVDRFYNDFPGWTIDNIKVLNAACVPGFQPSAAPMIALPQAVPRGQISVINSPNPITDVNTTVFTVRGVRAEALKIQIFDLSGALVFEREVVGNELTWHTDNNYGEYLANGVYLYRALVRVGREWIVTGVRKLVILR